MQVVLATGGFDHKITIWESSGKDIKVMKFPESQINCLDVSKDKKLLAAAGNPIIHLYDINGNIETPNATLDGHSGNVTSIGFQKDGIFIFIFIFPCPIHFNKKLRERPGKWLYSGSEDGTIKIWDLYTLSCKRTFDCSAAVNTVLLSPNQSELISGN